MKSEQEVNLAIDEYADMVKRICMMHLKNEADTEDIFQTVFLKYAFKSPCFEDKQHEKAWIIRVSINACKDLLKSFFRSHFVSLDDINECVKCVDETHQEVLGAVLSLPVKYKDVIYLYYFEGYSAVEISVLLKKNVNSIYTLLRRGKQLLKKQLGGDENVESN